MHCGIIDELHSIKDRNIYDVSKQSMGARTQPLLLIISTAGFVRENIYDNRYEYIIEGLLNTLLISFFAVLHNFAVLFLCTKSRVYDFVLFEYDFNTKLHLVWKSALNLRILC
mgnify:CR=1 FL=1